MRPILLAILLGGVVAGTLDIGAACLASGKDPVFILHVIAMGLIGKQASFAGGAQTAALGAVLQELMSILIGAIFVLVSLRLPMLRRAWVAAGLAYGAAVFFVMNYVVVPLSAVGHAPHFAWPWFLKNMAAMLVFGLIIAFFARQQLGAESH